MDFRLLDPRIFQSLASRRRVEILRLLAQRPHTPTELARQLGVTEQTVTYHLSKLADAGLAARRPDERPWAYHELTIPGRELVENAPSAKAPATLAVVLALAAVALGISWWMAQPDPLPPNSLASPAPVPEWVAWVGGGAIVTTALAVLFLAVAAVGRNARRALRS